MPGLAERRNALPLFRPTLAAILGAPRSAAGQGIPIINRAWLKSTSHGTGGFFMFQVGDTVKLNSGGPVMTVEKAVNRPDGVFVVLCTWFDDRGEVNQNRFLLRA
jgi:uncharacterized protein YodC (DUF2158 family)